MAWGELRPLTAYLQNIVLDKPEISFGRAQVRDLAVIGLGFGWESGSALAVPWQCFGSALGVLWQ